MEKKPLTLSEMSRLGGLARAAKLTKERRSAIAKKASKARWKKARAVAAILCLLSLESQLCAQEKTPIRDYSLHWKPIAAMVGGQAADIYITQRNFSRGCTEANSGVYGVRPSTTRLVAVKAAALAPAFVGALLLQATGHQTAARWMAGTISAIGFGAAGYNLTVNCGGAR